MDDIWPDIDGVMASYDTNPVLEQLRAMARQTEREKAAIAERSLEVRDKLLQTAAGWPGN